MTMALRDRTPETKATALPPGRPRRRSAAQRAAHLKWLGEITHLPTASGREDAVITWVQAWTRRRRGLQSYRDPAGNLVVGASSARSAPIRLWVTAHLDHPAFVVREVVDRCTVTAEFRGGVADAYFDRARVELFDPSGVPHLGTVVEHDLAARPFKLVTVRLDDPAASLEPESIGRWAISVPRSDGGDLFHAPACDDLAGVAAALAVLDTVRGEDEGAEVTVLLTRAEEVGFVGAIAACTEGTIPADAKVICLETSRTSSEAPVGGGPILRVGDRLSVFSHALTNRVAALAQQHADFPWQRKLMTGGACEATAFAAFGYETTCLCLAMDNFHNMGDIDEVEAGMRPAEVRAETISTADYQALVDLLVLTARHLGSTDEAPLTDHLGQVLSRHGHLVGLR